MKYDVTKKSAPKMPNLGKGTECVKLLLSQASKMMHEPLVPMLFPSLGAHVSGAEFQYPDRTWKELCGMMANLVAVSGDNKGQLSPIVNAICRDFIQHDKEEGDKLEEWSILYHKKKNAKETPVRPEVAFWFPTSNVTLPALILNAKALEKFGDRTQYMNMPEVEMVDKMCGGHKEVSQMLRNIYDRQRIGALRATAEGVSGNPLIRVNLTLSANPYTARKYYKYELHNGTFGRMVFSYKPRGGREGKIPRQGEYPDSFYEELDTYLLKLTSCKGRYIIRPLNKLIDRLAADMATLAELTDDDVLFEMSHRALVSAWKAGCVMWILNDQTWTKAMGELVEWLVYHDIWSKFQVFADMLDASVEASACEKGKSGPRNMLEDLPDTFNEAQLEALRAEMGKLKEGARQQLRVWANRKLITYSNQTGMYSKVRSDE